MSSKGYIYILSNPSMPGLLKIGRSIHGGKKRGRDIDQTGVPTPFVVEWEMLVEDCEYIESAAHEVLSEYRVNFSREFFKVDITEAITVITNEYLTSYHCHCVAHELDYIDPSTLRVIGRDLMEKGVELYPPDLKMILDNFVTADDLLEAVKRWQKRASERRAVMEEQRKEKGMVIPADLPLMEMS